MENKVITINKDVFDYDLKLSDIVTHNNKSYYVDTAFVFDAFTLETMVFEMKNAIVDDYDIDNESNIKKLMDLVDWKGIYTERYIDKQEAEKNHNRIVNNIFKYGRAEGAVN